MSVVKHQGKLRHRNLVGIFKRLISDPIYYLNKE